jgi:RHH-type transcriptional regulator, rel operon repressor / antitoxin RelB
MDFLWLTFATWIFSMLCKRIKQTEHIMKTETVSARLSPETAKKFALLAKAINRSKSYLAAEAIENYVNDQQWQIDAILKGIKEADEGKFVTDRQLRDTLSKWGVDED